MLGSIPSVVIGALIVLLVVVIVLIAMVVRLRSLLRTFMTGKDGSSLEATLSWLTHKAAATDATLEAHKEALEVIDARVKRSIRGYSLIRYDAYESSGGGQSFASGLLDEHQRDQRDHRIEPVRRGDRRRQPAVRRRHPVLHRRRVRQLRGAAELRRGDTVITSGGIVAYEMARQLQSAGQPVEPLLHIGADDAGCPALFIAIGDVMHQRQAHTVTDEPVGHAELFVRLLHDWRWWLGSAVSAVGFGLQAAALGRGSVLLVQAVLVTSVLFALPMSAYQQHRRLTRSDWLWAVLLAASVIVILCVLFPTASARPAWLRRRTSTFSHPDVSRRRPD